ncbi:MAG TPA: pyroglutamyl-peptidase I [Firmicutes bacterium]|nr:pyroglutamyl-peptidase I [Bacillota bacterium]
MKILVTGFAPFGGEKINPAYEAVKLLPSTIAGTAIIKAELPTVFRKGAQVLQALINAHNPDAVLCIGQAGGRPVISVERVAINLQDARIADNEGNCPNDETISVQGKTAYFSNLPTKAIVQFLRGNGVPAALSYTAGTYVCNDVLYHLLYWIDTLYPQMQGGFIHVPYDPAQVVNLSPPAPSMPIAAISEGLRLALIAIINS